MIPAFILRGFWDELEKRGVSIAELERAAHVSRPRSGDFGSLISETAMYALFEAAQVVSGDATIGLTTGRAIGSSGFHVLGHLALAGNNLSQAVALLARAQPQIAAHALLDDLGDGQMRFGFLRTDACASPGARVRAELSAVLLHDVALHYFLPGTRELPRVQLAFPPPANRAPYERAFPGGVEFDGQGTFVFFRRAALARHSSGADPWLRDQFFFDGILHDLLHEIFRDLTTLPHLLLLARLTLTSEFFGLRSRLGLRPLNPSFELSSLSRPHRAELGFQGSGPAQRGELTCRCP